MVWAESDVEIEKETGVQERKIKTHITPPHLIAPCLIWFFSCCCVTVHSVVLAQ